MPLIDATLSDGRVRIDGGCLNARYRINDDGDAAVSPGDQDIALVDLGHGGFGLAHGALRMNAATRIDGLMANRTTGTRRNRGMEVLGVHPKSSGSKREGNRRRVDQRVSARAKSHGTDKSAMHTVPELGTVCS